MTEPVLVEYFNQHYYKVIVDGKTHYLPSVTTKKGAVLKHENLERWRGDIGNREADWRMREASEKGTRIHWAWEIALNGGCVVYDPWKAPALTPEGVEALRKKHNGQVAILKDQSEMWDLYKLQRQFDVLQPKVLGVEKKVYDIEHREAGTIDHIYFIDEGEYQISGREPVFLKEGIYVGDLKTGSYVDDNVWLQLAPYAYMFEKMHGVQVAGALITHTGATVRTGIPGLKTLVRPRETLLTQDYDAYRHVAALWERLHGHEVPSVYEFPAIIELKINKENQQNELRIAGN